MAAKRKAVKIDDCQRVLEIRSPSTSLALMTAHLPDLLMRANRRQYTQSRAYDFRLKVGNVAESVEHGFEIYTLSNAWWVKRSIEMAKGVWLDNTKEERALLGDNRAKYSDFVISCVVSSAGNFANLYQYTPNVSSGTDEMTHAEVASDESIYEATIMGSTLKNDSDTNVGFTVTAAGSSPATFNIFDEYLLSRSITPDADTRDGPYEDLFDLDEDALDNLQTDGDLTPWDADAFPSPFVLQDTIGVDQGSGARGTLSSKFITAPLGIVIIRKIGSTGGDDHYAGTEKLLLEVRKGTYKGVHAPAYKAMQGPHRGLA